MFLDRRGRWFHDGQHVRHERLSRLLHRSIARDAAGRLVVTTGRDVMPFVCEDTPLFVRSVRPEGDALVLVLSDERTEPLTDQVVHFSDDDRLRVLVHGGSLWALAERPAHQALQARLRLVGDDLRLDVAGGSRPVERGPPPLTS